MPKKNMLKLAQLLAFAAFFWSIGYAHAYESYVVSNLNRTRDALLDQRKHLRDQVYQIRRKMSDLDKQLSIVEGYMRDTDRALRDVDDAIRRSK